MRKAFFRCRAGEIGVDCLEEELRKYFEQFGKVDDVEWPYDRTTKNRRNFAFIVFEEEDAADRAAASPKHTFGEREVRENVQRIWRLHANG